jgi:dihydrofolate reductase
MAKLIYTVIASLDGYIADNEGNFDWAVPDDEVHAFVNELERPVGTYLYGRRMYEVMAAWQSLELHDQPAFVRDFAKIWQAADKFVYSTSLEDVSMPRTHLQRSFSPEAVREMKSSLARDLAIGGPNLAAQAFKAQLVDVCHLFLAPTIVGGGTSAFPAGIRLKLILQDERHFANGMVYLDYRSRKNQAA